MKKKMLTLCGAALLLAAGATAWVSINSNSDLPPLVRANVQALAEVEEDGLVKDHFLKSVDGGVETGVFTRTGTLTILGVTISGNKGDYYYIAWNRDSCEEAKNSKCDPDEQGVTITAVYP